MNESWSWMLWGASLAAGGFVVLLLLSIGPVWTWLAECRIRDLTPRLRDLRLPVERLPFYLKLWGLAMLGTLVLLGIILQMLPIAVVAVYLIYQAPRIILNLLLARRQTQLRDQMVGACVALANATRAGLSLGQGLGSVAEETPEPLASELRHIVHEFQGGRPLADALNDAKARLRLDGFTLFANAVLVTLERGGRISDALENISVSLQENQRLERKIEAETASGRRIVVTLAIFPFGFLGLFWLLDPAGTSLIFQHWIGQLVLVVVILVVWTSVWWSRKILNIEL